MTSRKQTPNWFGGISLRGAISALTLASVFGLTSVGIQSAQAQTYNVIHNFTGGVDGAGPGAVTVDQAGNFVWNRSKLRHRLQVDAFGGFMGF